MWIIDSGLGVVALKAKLMGISSWRATSQDFSSLERFLMGARIFEAKCKHVILMCSGASSSSLKDGPYKPSFAGFVGVDLTDKKLSLRSSIDHSDSVVESPGAGGKTCITSRVYPTLAIYENAHLNACNNATETITIEKLDAWSMNISRMN
ncbi:beta-fructofuranosidase, insoluble isoenzyme 1-like [Olea europaea var. sylvestris]|uniref:beta-fructofuranosidase, insoluble isoenzyme 1-like n=1 Tax=Olea europaea var. sylvestris TaxID=158386 RepID=UPI000C1D6280|nr:beta-fructofuranosidase, insoluble isoenzyme 1-like [Olea europaea var. sylvestris]